MSLPAFLPRIQDSRVHRPRTYDHPVLNKTLGYHTGPDDPGLTGRGYQSDVILYGDDEGTKTGFMEYLRGLDAQGSAADFGPACNLYHGPPEIKVAIVRTTHSGAPPVFTAGEVYFGNCLPREIERITANGTFVGTRPWVTLPAEESGKITAVCVDPYNTFGGDLIAVTDAGGVWRVTAAGVASKITTQAGVDFDAVITVPNDATQYGFQANKILAGVALSQGGSQGPNLYVISAGSPATVLPFELRDSNSVRIPIEDLDIVAATEANEDLYVVSHITDSVYRADHTQFSTLAGAIVAARGLNDSGTVVGS